MAKIREYTGKDITVFFDAKRCIHAEECVHGMAAVFNIDERPWIQPDNGPAAELAAVIDRCPTGALQYRRNDGGEQEVAPSENQIRPVASGPVYIHGDVEITLADGTIGGETRLALCTCGASANKPFCDNSHRQIDYQSELNLDDKQSGCDGATQGEKLTITPLADGPNLLSGAYQVMSPDDEAIFCDSKGALCRCGGSARKPFCDGTHRHNGFTSE